MEIEGPEDHMIFLEQAVNKDVAGQEPAPGIVPDGKDGFGDGYSLFSEENVCIEWICEHILKFLYPKENFAKTSSCIKLFRGAPF